MKLPAYCWLLAAFLFPLMPSAHAQEKPPLNVAIFLYEGVEILDFAGPSEVFASTPGFRTYTVSADGKPLVSQRFIQVTPAYALDNAPMPDIVVFPGGNTGPTANDPKVVEWTKRIIAGGGIGMSVCTGAFVLANTGLLEGLNVTTHFGSLDMLQKKLPHSRVLEHTRWIDNGQILMTAGVSAGIDGALHLVARIKGAEVAAATAHYMEYDKWQADNGRVDYRNPYLQQLESHAFRLENGQPVFTLPAGTPLPYEGELYGLADGLVEKGDFQTAATVLETTIRWHPEADRAYGQLSIVYTQLGRPAPPDQASFLTLIDLGKMDRAYAIYQKTQQAFPGWKIFSEQAMNRKGYDLLQRKEFETAIKVFEINTMAFPNSWNAWDSLGEGYLNAGKKKEATASYEQSLKLNPDNTNGREMLVRCAAMK